MTRKIDPEATKHTPTFGENLREERERAGISREALALEAGVDRAAIGMYENGGREPRLRVLIELARALELPPAALLRDVR